MPSTSRPSVTQLGSAALGEALSEIAVVLADHAAALDRLESGEQPEAFTGELLGGADAVERGEGPSAGSDLHAVVDHVAVGAGLARDLGGVVDALRSGRSVAAGDAGGGLAAVLAGVGEALANADHLDAQRFAIGLEIAAGELEAHEGQRAAGELPAVVAVAADAALAAADAGVGLLDAVVSAADEGLAELEAGPVTNPRLSERGVVDAPAAGFLLVLDALASILTGEPLPSAPVVADAPTVVYRHRVRCELHLHEPDHPDAARWLEDVCDEHGQVEQLVAAGGHWRLDVVSGAPGALVEALLELGRPRELRIDLAAGARCSAPVPAGS